MNLLSPTEIKILLNKHSTRLSRGLGQNFLIDENTLEKIIKSAELKPDDVVLEIGPGIGTLTRELAKFAEKIVAVEKSQKMCEILNEVLAAKNLLNVQVVNADILKILSPESSLRGARRRRGNLEYVHKSWIASSVASLLPRNDNGYKVVANIPYYITAPLIRLFLENENQPEFMVLMVQKEVAQRICAKPPDMTLLSVSVQFYAEAKIMGYVSKNCFWPAPKVDSAIIKITPHKTVRAPSSIEKEKFFKVVKAGFLQPRKQLGNNFSKALRLDREQINLWLSKNNIKPGQRAETLSVQDWKNLANSI